MTCMKFVICEQSYVHPRADPGIYKCGWVSESIPKIPNHKGWGPDPRYPLSGSALDIWTFITYSLQPTNYLNFLQCFPMLPSHYKVNCVMTMHLHYLIPEIRMGLIIYCFLSVLFLQRYEVIKQEMIIVMLLYILYWIVWVQNLG